MNPSLDALLQPSLSSARPATTIYSTKATFWTSFFGGPFAALMIGGLNARHMGRLGKDALPLVGLTLASMLALVGIEIWSIDAEASTRRYAARGIGCVVWGALYLLHRPVYRAAEYATAAHRSGWVAGISVVLIASLVHGLMLLVVRTLVRT